MTQLAHALYLHGFASGPLTQKGQRLGERLRGAVASYAIPDLEAGDFPGLTMTAILARARAAVAALPDDGAPLLLVGSSLGGYCAALLAAELPRISAVLAIAPAFRFPRFFAERLGADGLARWRATGALPWFHHGAQQELPLGVAFLDSCAGLPELPPPPRAAPVAIVHGWQDETVPWRVSLDYAAQAPERIALHLIPGDHRLTAPETEQVIAEAALALLRR